MTTKTKTKTAKPKTPKTKKGEIVITHDANGQQLIEPLVVHEQLWTQGKELREMLDQQNALKKAIANHKQKLAATIRDNKDQFNEDSNNLDKLRYAQGGVELDYIHTDTETINVRFKTDQAIVIPNEGEKSPDELY